MHPPANSGIVVPLSRRAHLRICTRRDSNIRIQRIFVSPGSPAVLGQALEGRDSLRHVGPETSGSPILTCSH